MAFSVSRSCNLWSREVSLVERRFWYNMNGEPDVGVVEGGVMSAMLTVLQTRCSQGLRV